MKIIIILLAIFSFQASAHHSFFSQYDANKIETIEGKVTEVWFQNPHSRVYVEVTDDNGEVVLWETETYPRNILHRRGWKSKALKVGDEVIVTGRRARNDAHRIQIFTITRPSDGWKGVGYAPESID